MLQCQPMSLSFFSFICVFNFENFKEHTKAQGRVQQAPCISFLLMSDQINLNRPLPHWKTTKKNIKGVCAELQPGQPEAGSQAARVAACVTLFNPPAGSVQSFLSSSVRVLTSLRSVQWGMSKGHKSSRKMTCRKTNRAFGFCLGCRPLPHLHP